MGNAIKGVTKAMGKAYHIEGESEQQALDRGVKFADKVINRFRRNCHIVGIAPKGKKWTAVVDVCGKPDFAIAELARECMRE